VIGGCGAAVLCALPGVLPDMLRNGRCFNTAIRKRIVRQARTIDPRRETRCFEEIDLDCSAFPNNAFLFH
jgi:hypothetical protein